MLDEQVLERSSNWVSYDHTCYGRIQSVYIRKDRKWLKIGEVCTRCGELGFLKDFKEAIKKKRLNFGIDKKEVEEGEQKVES